MPLQSVENHRYTAPALLCFTLAGVIVLGVAGSKLGVAVIAALLGASIFAFVHPLVPFAFYFGALFFKDTTFGTLPISLNQVLAPIFFASTILHAVKGRALPVRFTLLPILLVAAAYFAMRGFTGEHFENGLLYARYVVIYLFLAVSIAVCMSTERTILALAWIIVVLTAISAGSGFYEAYEKNLLGSFSGNWGTGFRVKGTAPNSIVFAWNMLFAFPFAFLLFAELRSRYTRALAMALGVIILGAATITFNRQTYLVMAIMLALCSVLYIYKNRTVFLGFLTVFGGAAAFTILPLIVKRLLTVTSLGKDYSFLERRDSFLIGVEMLKHSPIVGVGFGSFPKVWGKYIPKEYSTYFAQYRGYSTDKFMDMGYMAVAAETGIIGLAIFFAILVTILLRSWNYRKAARLAGDHFARNMASMVIVILVFVTLTSAIQDTFLYTRVWIWYALALLLDERVLPIRPATDIPAPLSEGDDPRLPVTP